MKRLFWAGASTKKKSFWLFAISLPLLLGGYVQPVESANCYCRFIASQQFRHPIMTVGAYPGQGGVPVLQLGKDGYMQNVPGQKGKCEDYCRGQWGERDKMDLAKKYPGGEGITGACGDIGLAVFAAIGTAPYERINTGVFNVGSVVQVSCSAGWWSHPDPITQECRTGAGCRVPGIPDQDLKGDYFFWKEDLYKRAKSIVWTCKR